MNDITNILLIASVLLLVSVLGGTANRAGLPTLIFFLVTGILAGSEGIGGIHFDNPRTAQFAGIVALNFILFSGGLDTNLQHIKPVLWKGISLSTAGVVITAFSVGLFVHLVFDFTLTEGLLLGSIVSSTDAAAVFSILRGKGIGLKGNLRPVLELESGSNDPMAYFLTIMLTQLLSSNETGFGDLVIMFIKGFLIGGVIGYAMGKFSNFVINRIKLEADGLYPVLVMGLAIFTYSFADTAGGNGFLAIYLSAVILGNSNFIHRRTLIKFFEGQAWLMQIALFLTLGLLVFPSQVVPFAGAGLLISGFLIFIARPLAVFISFLPFKSNIRTRLFISWVGLRGAVPIVFATYPMIAGISRSGDIFNLVFFISVSSVLLQGTTLSYVAKLFHVSVPAGLKRKGMEVELTDSIKSEMHELVLKEGAACAGRKIVELGIPVSVNIMAIRRGDIYISPKGSTTLYPNDRMFILAEDKAALKTIVDILESKG